jgi:hypothetical protein
LDKLAGDKGIEAEGEIKPGEWKRNSRNMRTVRSVDGERARKRWAE